jgi:hypothetical protein
MSVGPRMTLRVPERWQSSGMKYANAQELILPARAAAPGGPPAAQPPAADYPMARVLITTETRTSHEDALRRLQDLAASRPGSARFVEIGG